MGSLAKQIQGQSDQVKMYAKGGKVEKHMDAVEDKKLIKKVVKSSALKPGLKKGGKCK